MLKRIFVLFLVAVACVVILAMRKPDTIHVERSLSMRAPPEKIFPLIADFHAWNGWSPYDQLDSAMKRNYSGSASGMGAVYEWSGNRKVGQGRMEITEHTPSSKVGIKLDFVKPFESHNTGTFTLAPSGDETTVTWAMDGPSPFISKVMSVFVNMDKMIGKDFEAGLANLKASVER